VHIIIITFFSQKNTDTFSAWKNKHKTSGNMIASWPLDPLSFETSNLRFKKMTPDGVDENRKYVYKATKQRGITKGRTYTSKVFIKEILDLISKLLI
jgi:hypothetical protein